MPPCSVAVLGGGITGLSAAFHLARNLPSSSRIVLFEKRKRLGGLVQSERVEVNVDSERKELVVLEQGPRTLRPSNKALLELVKLLELESSLVTIPKTHPSARARYLYIPPLTLLPSSFISLLGTLFSAALRPLLPAIIWEVSGSYNRPPGITDESVDSFISRRFGEEIARRFVSALTHGIYAADSRNLSVRSTFPMLWDAEEKGNGSVLQGFVRMGSNKSESESQEYEIEGMVERMKGISVYTFRNGMETLTEALRRWLECQPNVEIHTGVDIKSVVPTGNGVEIITDTGTHPLKFERVISTIPLPSLHTIIPSEHALPHLLFNPSSTVHVLNLIFPPTPRPIHPPGFGYLIPRPLHDYPSEGVSLDGALLGTVFDSSMSDSSTVTQMTLMMGGPYSLSSSGIDIQAVLRTLSSHLGEPLPEPIFHRVTAQTNCIPTYKVGHLDRMAELQNALGREPWDGKLDVIGAGVGGVSVGDCVESGRKAALKCLA